MALDGHAGKQMKIKTIEWCGLGWARNYL